MTVDGNDVLAGVGYVLILVGAYAMRGWPGIVVVVGVSVLIVGMWRAMRKWV